MFRVLIWGECAIIAAMALIAYILIQNSENLRDTLKGKLIVILMIVMAVVLFILSFDCVRKFLITIFW
jgi:hypothetical protein